MWRNKKWMVTYFYPISRDLDTGNLSFNMPKFSFTLLKGKPCPTRWLYDWFFSIGYISIWKRA